MSNVVSAFNVMLGISSRAATLKDRKNSLDYNIQISPSNYFRNLVGPEEIQIEGSEFVISDNVLSMSGLVGEIKRGMQIIDVTRNNETHTIGTVKPLYIMGNLVGFRVRTE